MNEGREIMGRWKDFLASSSLEETERLLAEAYASGTSPRRLARLESQRAWLTFKTPDGYASLEAMERLVAEAHASGAHPKYVAKLEAYKARLERQQLSQERACR